MHSESFRDCVGEINSTEFGAVSKLPHLEVKEARSVGLKQFFSLKRERARLVNVPKPNYAALIDGKNVGAKEKILVVSSSKIDWVVG